MIEFRPKVFYSGHDVGGWQEILNLETRSVIDFEFSYSDYRIDGTVYTSYSIEFEEAFDKQKFWLKLTA